MLNIPTKIILYGTEADLKSSVCQKLECIGLTCDITEANSPKMLRSTILEEKQSIVICDMRSHESSIRNMLAEHFNERKFFCIFIVDRAGRSSRDIAGTDRFNYIESSSELSDIVISIMDAYFILALFASKIILCNVNRNDMHEIVREQLIDFGMSERAKGFGYLSAAICAVAKDKSLGSMITKKLYVMIGKQFGVTSFAVERSIRTLIKGAWESKDKRQRIIAALDERTSSHSSMSNSEFITLAACNIRRQLKLAASTIESHAADISKDDSDDFTDR